VAAAVAVIGMAAWLTFRPREETVPGRPDVRPPAAGTADVPPALPPSPIPEPPDEGPPPSLPEIRGQILAGDRTEGLDRLDRLIEREPGNAEALELRGRTHLGMRWWRQADRDFRLAIRAEGETPARLQGRAEALLPLRKVKEAERLVRRARELEGDEPTARSHALLALIHLRRGRKEEARDELHRALLLDPEDRIALRVQARLE